MKRPFFIVFLAVILMVLIAGCIFGPSIQNITIHNASDYIVTNITLKYYHAKGERIESVDILQLGEIKTLSVVTQDLAIQTMTTGVEIEYYINGVKFDVNNEENSYKDQYGNIYTKALIGAGLDTKFIIKNDRYIVENINK